MRFYYHYLNIFKMKKRYQFPLAAPKITSRALRLRSFTNVAYKDDGDGALEKALLAVDAKLSEFKSTVTKEAGAKADQALTELKAIVDFTNAEFEKKWNEKQAELMKKDATIGEIKDELKELKARGGRLRVAGERTKVWIGDVIADKILEHKAAIAASDTKPLEAIQILEKTDWEKKTVGNIATANLSGTGNNYVSYLDWQPGMEPTDQFRFRSLFRVIQSETDFVRFPRANSPIGEGSFGRITEAATKPQIDRDYTMIDLTLKPMAGYAIVSRQSLRNIIFLQSWLPTSLMEQLMDSEDTDFANTLVAAATGSTSTTGLNDTSSYGKLVAYRMRQKAAKYTPNFIAVDPVVEANLLTLKSSGSEAFYQQPGFVNVAPNGTISFLGLPVYGVNWLTGGRILMGDSRRAAIVQSEGLVLRQTDSHASTFITNELTYLLERTEGLAIFRPDAFTTAVF